jgi:hypothetical protein
MPAPPAPRQAFRANSLPAFGAGGNQTNKAPIAPPIRMAVHISVVESSRVQIRGLLIYAVGTYGSVTRKSHDAVRLLNPTVGVVATIKLRAKR